MPFESVYRVSARISAPTPADVDALRQKLGMELPLGYREFVTTFGPGAISDFLVVNMPSEIENSPGENLAQVAQWHREGLRESVLTPEQIEESIVFARAAAEAPIWIASRSLGPRLFEEVEGDVVEVNEAFFGAVELETRRQNHEFPFFEPYNGRRRMRVLAVRPGISPNRFVELMANRWARESLRCSRTSTDELYPHYFVPAIEGHIELLLGETGQLPPDSFYVRARYDIDSEADLAAFVEPLLLPGGGPHDFIGKSW